MPDLVVTRAEPEVVVWVVVRESEVVWEPLLDGEGADVVAAVELRVRPDGGSAFPDPRYRATATTAATARTAAPLTAVPAPDRLLANLTRVRRDVVTH